MNKHKLKRNEYDAEQFRKSDPPQQWPQGVQVNDLSPTGYSYGTLVVTPEGRDGFEVVDNDWIFYNVGSGAYRVSEENYDLLYEAS